MGGLAARRRALGLTQGALAETLGRDVSTVARWERGEAMPRPRHRRAYADALRVTLAELDVLIAGVPSGISPVPAPVRDWSPEEADRLCDAVETAGSTPITAEAATRLVHHWLVAEPPQVVERRAGRRVGRELAVRVTRRADRLRHLDDHVAGTDLELAVARELRATDGLLREASYSDEVGRRLLAALGDLCQLAGRVAADAGRDVAAARHYAVGIAAAHAASDRPLAGHLVSTLAYHTTNTGDPHDALLLAESALAGTETTATGTTRALFHDRAAWAHAHTGGRVQTERALGRAEAAFADRQPQEDPAWTYWLTPDELDVMAGRCFVVLGLPDEARPRLRRALGGYDEDRPREAALYWSWLAEAELMRGDVGEAAALASRVTELAGHTASTRSHARVHRLRALLDPHRRHPAVRAFRERLEDTPGDGRLAGRPAAAPGGQRSS